MDPIRSEAQNLFSTPPIPPEVADSKHSVLNRPDTFSSMASSAPPSSGPGFQNPRRSIGFLANAMKRKDSFIQFFAMTGILLLSMRSLGQKYHLHDLQEDTSALIEERDTLTERMKKIKRDLLHEASLDPTGSFSARLHLLFGEED